MACYVCLLGTYHIIGSFGILSLLDHFCVLATTADILYYVMLIALYGHVVNIKAMCVNVPAQCSVTFYQESISADR